MNVLQDRIKQQFLDSELAANIAVSKVAESMIEEERSHHSDLAIKSYYNNHGSP